MIYTLSLNPAVDMTYLVPNFAQGCVLRADSVIKEPAGKGVNVSRTLRALGGESVAMGVLGGAQGRFIRDTLVSEGIACDFVRMRAETRVNVKITDPVQHTHTDINAKGASLSARSLRALETRLLARVLPGDTVALCGSLPAGCAQDTYARLIAALHAKGARAWLDASGEALALGIAAKPDLVKPNWDELASLRLGTDALTAARALCAQGVRTVCVSLGEKGALLVTRGYALRAKPPVITAKSTTGAGDALFAALLLARSRGDTPDNALRLAVACGTAKVACDGTKPPAYGETLALAKEVTIEEV